MRAASSCGCKVNNLHADEADKLDINIKGRKRETGPSRAVTKSTQAFFSLIELSDQISWGPMNPSHPKVFTVLLNIAASNFYPVNSAYLPYFEEN